MRTFYLVLFFISISIFSVSQPFLKIENRILEKLKLDGFVTQYALNSSSAQNFFKNSCRVKSLLKNQTTKNAKVFEQKLDSIRIIDNNGVVYEKNIFKYDFYGNCIENIWFIHYRGKLIEKEKYELTYDDFGNLIKDAEFYWNDSLTSWINKCLIEHTYSNNLLIESVFGRLVDEEIDYSYKTEYSYNVNGNVIEEKHFKFAEIYPGVSDWKYMGVDSFQYNGFNQIIKYISYKIDLEFKSSAKINYCYDETGNLATRNSYYWNEDLNSWENSGEREFIYDEAGNIILATIFSWDRENQKFTGTSKWDLTYDNNNNMLSCMDFNISKDIEKWEPNQLYFYEYSEKGNVLEYKSYEWDNGNDDFFLTENISFEYDESVSNDEIALPANFNEPLFEIIEDNLFYLSVTYRYFTCNHKPVKAIFKYPENGNLVDVGEWQFHYSSFETTGISEILNSDFSIFPNPATESISFDWLNNSEVLHLEIFSIHGQQVFNEKINKIKSVSIKNLNKGIYFYRLSDHKKIMDSGKLVIQ